MVITDFSRDQFGGEPGDIYYQITFAQWRRQIIRIEKAAAKPAPKREELPETPTTYTVVRGDSLWKISKKFYGTGSKWRTIYNANRSLIGGNPNLIHPGQVLKIP